MRHHPTKLFFYILATICFIIIKNFIIANEVHLDYSHVTKAQPFPAVQINTPYKLYQHFEIPHNISFHPKEKTIAIGDSSGLVWFWSISGIDSIKSLKILKEAVSYIKYSKDGLSLAVGGKDGNVAMWDLKRKKPQAWLNYKHKNTVTSILFDENDSSIFTSSLDGSIIVRDAVTGKKISSYYGHSSDITGIVISNDNRCIISTSNDRSIQSWLISTGEQADFSSQGSKVTALAISHDNKKIAFATEDGMISVRRIDGCLINTVALRFVGHSSVVRSIIFDSKDETFFSAGDDKKIFRWDLETTFPIEILSGHTDAVSSLSIDSSGQFLASSAKDKTIRIWKITPYNNYKKHINND